MKFVRASRYGKQGHCVERANRAGQCRTHSKRERDKGPFFSPPGHRCADIVSKLAARRFSRTLPRGASTRTRYVSSPSRVLTAILRPKFFIFCLWCFLPFFHQFLCPCFRLVPLSRAFLSPIMHVSASTSGWHFLHESNNSYKLSVEK